MGRKKKPEIVVGEGGQRCNLDDFDLDSCGVEAPECAVDPRRDAVRRCPVCAPVPILDRYGFIVKRSGAALGA
jgi:hypothetical protein